MEEREDDLDIGFEAHFFLTEKDLKEESMSDYMTHGSLYELAHHVAKGAGGFTEQCFAVKIRLVVINGEHENHSTQLTLPGTEASRLFHFIYENCMEYSEEDREFQKILGRVMRGEK